MEIGVGDPAGFRTGARTGSAEKLYLANRVCFCFIFTFAPHWERSVVECPCRHLYCDPNRLGLACVHSESERSSALPVGTRQQNRVPWLTCPTGIRTLSHTHTRAGTPTLCLVICYPLLKGLRWGPCCFYTAECRGSTVNGQIA